MMLAVVLRMFAGSDTANQEELLLVALLGSMVVV